MALSRGSQKRTATDRSSLAFRSHTLFSLAERQRGIGFVEAVAEVRKAAAREKRPRRQPGSSMLPGLSLPSNR